MLEEEFLWQVEVCVVLWGLWESNNRTFREVERHPSDI